MPINSFHIILLAICCKLYKDGKDVILVYKEIIVWWRQSHTYVFLIQDEYYRFSNNMVDESGEAS